MMIMRKMVSRWAVARLMWSTLHKESSGMIAHLGDDGVKGKGVLDCKLEEKWVGGETKEAKEESTEEDEAKGLVMIFMVIMMRMMRMMMMVMPLTMMMRPNTSGRRRERRRPMQATLERA